MIQFTVPGVPLAMQRHRTFTTKSGQQRQYTPPETIMYQNMVKMCCREAMNETNHERIMGPVRVSARYYFPIPRSRANRIAEGQRHTQKPDLDNLIKNTKDGITGAGWSDDCIVCEIVASKHWTHIQPKADITLEEL